MARGPKESRSSGLAGPSSRTRQRTGAWTPNSQGSRVASSASEKPFLGSKSGVRGAAWFTVSEMMRPRWKLRMPWRSLQNPATNQAPPRW